MHKLLILPVLIGLTVASGCKQTPVEPARHDLQPAMDQNTAPADSTSRGGNVMGSGH